MAATDKILAKVIVEVAGKPKEHVDESLKIVIDRITEEKNIKIVKKEVFKAKKAESFFSAFSEMELKFESAAALIGFCFDYMPSSIEIIEPEETIRVGATELSGLMNDLLSRLHGINMGLSQIKVENDNLQRNAESLLKNIIMLSLKEKPKKIDEISKEIGIQAESLMPFLDNYVKEGKLEKDKDSYKLSGSLY